MLPLHGAATWALQACPAGTAPTEPSDSLRCTQGCQAKSSGCGLVTDDICHRLEIPGGRKQQEDGEVEVSEKTEGNANGQPKPSLMLNGQPVSPVDAQAPFTRVDVQGKEDVVRRKR